MKSCLICETPVKWVKFKSRDGHLCKACYQVASRDFTETVTAKSHSEIEAIFRLDAQVDQKPHFETTKKIQEIVLFDENHQTICLPNNQRYAKEKASPDYFAFAELKKCEVIEDIFEKKEKKETKRVGTIKVRIQLKNPKVSPKEIWLIGKHISVASMPYKSMKSLAEKIVKEFQRIS